MFSKIGTSRSVGCKSKLMNYANTPGCSLFWIDKKKEDNVIKYFFIASCNGIETFSFWLEK